MAVTLNKLTDGFVRSAGPGDYGDGGGLYLQVTPSEAKSWVFRYKWHGKTTRLGLGPAHAVSLREARLKAAEHRRLLADDINPRSTRSAEIPTFSEAFKEFAKAQGAGWSNAKHSKQWQMTMEVYAKGQLPIPVDQIEVGHIQDVLLPVWYTKPETARRVRQRIAKILGFAAARKWRSRENPADWKNNLEHILKSNSDGEEQHHRALPYTEAPAFMLELATREAISARMLELAILTGSRTNEITGVRWEHIDLEKGEWTRPAGVMKTRRSHTVYLGPRALKLLKQMHLLSGKGEYLEGNIAAVVDDLGTNSYEFLPQAGQRPVPDRLGPAGMPRPRRELWRAASPARRAFLCSLLKRHQNTPIFEQGFSQLPGGVSDRAHPAYSTP